MLDGTARADGIPASASGADWMARGLRAPLRGDYRGAAFVFEATGGTARARR